MAARAVRRLVRRAARRVGLVPIGTRRAMQARLRRVRRDRRRLRGRLAAVTASRDRLAARVQAVTDELEGERAAAALATGRDRADLSYLFVVTYGRSGSTLLQGILSATPGVLIRGENGGVLQQLFQFHDTLRRHRERLARSEPLPPNHPWWGIDGYRDDTALRGIRALMLETVLRPGPDTRVVGFKEITWLPERLPEYLSFVRAVFPGARFVLNTRDLGKVATSKWWARNTNALAELQAMEAAYVDALEALGENAFRVHYDDYVADPATLRPLFDWLGEEFDEARVRGVLGVPHSY